MSETVDIRHAEVGKKVKVEFVTLSSGQPYVPSTLSVSVIDPATNSVLDILVPNQKTDPGEFEVVWDIPTTITPNKYYVIRVDADNGAFTDDITFKVYPAGHFSPSASTSSSVIPKVKELSKTRSEEGFVGLVRAILRDHQVLNRLTAGREHSDGDIRLAMAMAISEYNNTPPPLAHADFKNFPSLAFLVIGTIAWLLNSSSFLRLRNTLNYSDGSTNVELENFPQYQQLAQYFSQVYSQWVTTFKVSKNINDAFGVNPTGVHSEYVLLSELLGDAAYGGGSTLLQ